MARGKSEPQVFVAKESGSAEVDGENVTFVKGVTRVRKGHKILEQLRQFFEPADEHLSYDVEAATAAPGEKRDDPAPAPAPVVTASVEPASADAPQENK